MKRCGATSLGEPQIRWMCELREGMGLMRKWRVVVMHRTRAVGVAVAAAILLTACQPDDFITEGPKHLRPVSASLVDKMEMLRLSQAAPIMIRIFKKESELEVWKRASSGRYVLLETFEICKWSGELGPKMKEGDRQAPEGFYEITPALMNPHSSYHLAFNMGFPNTFDRAHERTGSHLMVHGACSSRGCYAMTDEQIQDIYALAREAFRGGQRTFQVQAFPFRMTPENMVEVRDSEHIAFWRMLKRGYDHFEVTRVPPKVDVCEKQYVFDATPLVEGVPFQATAQCPAFNVPDAIEVAVAEKERADEVKFERIVASLEAAEERRRHWAETETRIAALFTGGQIAKASDAVDVNNTASGDAETVIAIAETGITENAAITATVMATEGGTGPAANPLRASTKIESAGDNALASLLSFRPWGGGAANADPAPSSAPETALVADDLNGPLGTLETRASAPDREVTQNNDATSVSTAENISMQRPVSAPSQEEVTAQAEPPFWRRWF